MIAPAPWQLHGRAYAFALKTGAAQRTAQSGAPAALGEPRGARSILMFVDYASSDVGPYRELLFIPGHYRFPDGRRYNSIGRIYVSSQDSVDNGRSNWGIPKDHADFEVEQTEAGDQVTVSLKGRPFCRLMLAHGGPALPVSSAWVPQKAVTLAQLREGHMFRYTPQAKGRLQLARLKHFWADGEHFPALQAGNWTVGGYMPAFDMTFPVSAITGI